MSDDSVTTICGTFATREAADRAVEHLVQDLGLARADVFVAPVGEANSAGTEPSGGDAGREADGAGAALRGALLVSADVAADRMAKVEAALRNIGARDITRR